MVRLKIGLVTMAALFAGSMDIAAAECTTDTHRAKAGPICGIHEDTPTGNIADTYLGIPFAETTAGAHRWTAPRAKTPWREVFAATVIGPDCPQSGGNPKSPQSEDCLSLNVWTPTGAAGRAARLPVMVFIPGGGFIGGTGGDPAYNGSYLAANYDVVVVTINYRVGVLGFLAADGLEGNYGIRDQQLALRWVQENITAFGGDPARVTLFGESAGAISVGLHATVIPSSAALFRSVIMESNLLGLPLMTPPNARTSGNLFKQLAGCQTMECLRAAPVDGILRTQGQFQGVSPQVFTGWSGYNPIAPVVDGQLIVGQPMRRIQAGGALKPMIVGTNLNEGAWFSGQISELAGPNAFSLGTYLSFIAAKVGPQFERLALQYGVPSDSNGPRYTQIFTDYVFTCSNHALAENAAARGRALHMYQFTEVSPFNLSGVPACAGLVCHTDELPYVFHTAERLGFSLTPAGEVLSKQMMTYWTNFAKTLDPNLPLKPSVPWPAFERSRRDYLYLNTTLKSGAAPASACPLWDSIGYGTAAPPLR